MDLTVRASDVFHICVFVWETQWSGESSDLWSSHMNLIHFSEVESVSASRSIFQVPGAPAGFFVGKKGGGSYIPIISEPKQSNIKYIKHQKNIPKMVLVDCWEQSMQL